MNPLQAWNILSDRCKCAAGNPEETIAGLEALATAAFHLGLREEFTATHELIVAVRQQEAAQLRFQRLFVRPQVFGVSTEPNTPNREEAA